MSNRPHPARSHRNATIQCSSLEWILCRVHISSAAIAVTSDYRFSSPRPPPLSNLKSKFIDSHTVRNPFQLECHFMESSKSQLQHFEAEIRNKEAKGEKFSMRISTLSPRTRAPFIRSRLSIRATTRKGRQKKREDSDYDLRSLSMLLGAKYVLKVELKSFQSL